jgi:NADH-quinone oxidoreductase subunit M
MNLAVAGLYSLTLYGLQGSLITSLGHGLTSSALFCSAGFLYDRTNSRNLFTLAFVNLFNYYPVFSTIFFLFILANSSFPGTLNFIGESLSIISLSILEVTLSGLFSINVLLTSCYSLFLYKRSCCKILLMNYRNHTMDLSRF